MPSAHEIQRHLEDQIAKTVERIKREEDKQVYKIITGTAYYCEQQLNALKVSGTLKEIVSMSATDKTTTILTLIETK